MNDSRRERDHGFTLVEILIAIVVVGILSAVVVVGISSLTAKSNSASCSSSRDAAIAASNVHYTNSGTYPTKLSDMTTATPPELQLPSTVTISAAGTVADAGGWSLTITPGVAGAAPTFACGSGASGSGGSGSAAGTTVCPGTYAGWVGEYYSTVDLTGTVTVCRDDASVNVDWASGSPGSGVPADFFSVRWTKTVTFTAGSHAFTVGSDDGSRLYIDGVKVLDMWIDQAYATRSVNQTLTAGTHLVVMEFYERGGLARATLAWT